MSNVKMYADSTHGIACPKTNFRFQSTDASYILFESQLLCIYYMYFSSGRWFATEILLLL